MAEPLQHDETAFSTGIPAAGTGGHHPNRPKAGHALTFKLDQLVGAGQALMKHPDLLVVDEALAPFDLNVRGDLIKGIREHMRGRGIIWALESASSVEHFEEVVVMESGRILERGRTQELMECDGPLKALLAT